MVVIVVVVAAAVVGIVLVLGVKVYSLWNKKRDSYLKSNTRLVRKF